MHQSVSEWYNPRCTHVAEISTVESGVMLVRETFGTNGSSLHMFNMTFLNGLGISRELDSHPWLITS